MIGNGNFEGYPQAWSGQAVFRVDRALVQIKDAPADGQTEAAPAGILADILPGDADERLKYIVNLFRRKPRTGVFDDDSPESIEHG